MKYNTTIFNRTRTFFHIKGIIHFGYTEHRTKGGFFFLDLFNREIFGK